MGDIHSLFFHLLDRLSKKVIRNNDYRAKEAEQQHGAQHNHPKEK